MLFLEEAGRIYLANSSMEALREAQLAFEEEAERVGLKTEEDVVEELKDVVRRKFPDKMVVVDTLLAKMNYEFVYTPDIINETMFEIRDAKDYPVLYTAILEQELQILNI